MTLYELHQGQETPETDRAFRDALSAVMRTPEGRASALFIIRELGYFLDTTNEEEAACRRAALRLLGKIEALTGFTLNVNLEASVIRVGKGGGM